MDFLFLFLNVFPGLVSETTRILSTMQQIYIRLLFFSTELLRMTTRIKMVSADFEHASFNMCCVVKRTLKKKKYIYIYLWNAF